MAQTDIFHLNAGFAQVRDVQDKLKEHLSFEARATLTPIPNTEIRPCTHK